MSGARFAGGNKVDAAHVSVDSVGTGGYKAVSCHQTLTYALVSGNAENCEHVSDEVGDGEAASRNG